MNEKLMAIIKLREGLRLAPYKCSANKWTIGYGRNLERDGGGISKDEATYLLENDVAAVERQCEDEFVFWDSLCVVRQAVLIDMAFNMGMGGLLKFRGMLAAVKARAWEHAGEHLMDSTYASQVHGRAKANKAMLVTGDWPI